MTNLVKDVGDAEFQTEVIERSKQVPVLVDFWAPWCGPCRVLGPLLEREVEAAQGRVVLVKVNTDEHPRLSAAFGIQGIPAVKAFRDGVQVDEFVGALPAPAIADFIRRLVPSPAQELLRAALAKLGAGDPAAAQELLRPLLDDPDVANAATFHLAHTLVRTGGSPREIRELAERIHPAAAEFGRVDALCALATLLEKVPSGGVTGARAAVAENPRDHEARLSLAAAYLTQRDVKAALDALLESVSRNPGYADGAARKAILALFDHLDEPPAEPDLVREYRRQLQIVS